MSDDAILAELRPCGYVLATSQYKFFALKCLYCDKKYAYWAAFLEHLKRSHNTNADETSALPECNEEECWDSQLELENNEAVTEGDYVYDNENQDTKNIYKKDNGPFDDINDMDNQIEEMMYQNQEEEYGSTENVGYALETYTDNTNPIPIIENIEEYIENMHEEEEGPAYEENVSNIHGFNDIQIDLSKEDLMTNQFIEVYKYFPFIWSTVEATTSDAEAQMCIAKTQMLESLKKQNLFISLDVLENAILQIHQQYFDITKKIEKGVEISDVEEKYFGVCSFLQPYNNDIHEQNEILDKTGSEASLTQFNGVDNEKFEDSQSELDLSDDEIENLQSSLQQKQTILKFSTRNKITRDFIKCLRHYTCLWDPTENTFNDTKERKQAYDKIKKFFLDNHSIQLTEGKIKSDIKRLYTFYKRCITSHRMLNITRKNYYELCSFLEHAELNSYYTQRMDILRKISLSTPDELTRSFIDYCSMHPVLWDKSHANYSVLSSRKEAYDEIALNLQQFYNVQFNNEDLYYAISRLKHHYYSLQRRKQQQEPLTKEEQDLLDRCNFLPNIRNNIKCHICQRVLRSQCTLQTHLLKVHNIGELPYKCDYCEQRFAQRNTKKEHEVRAHTKEFEWFCPFCSKGFVNQRELEKHQMVHTGERKIICEQCGKRFRLKHQMTEHVKIVHERLRRYKCSMCPKAFLRKRTLDDHVRAHLNIRDKICSICNKGFTSVHGLFRHKQLHFEKRFECIKCGKCFHRFSGLRIHENLKHQSDGQTKSTLDATVADEDDEETNENLI